ncbi:MAG: GTP pyrophosphokinase family protein, partial [Clostridia bacterium]|nr:GTP pyrophosphokinase family protein [Clostridia bacterium]
MSETIAENLMELSEEEIDWFQENEFAFRELMAYFRCAMMETQTKFNVLNEELSLQYDRNPIETIKVRLKKPRSIVGKLHRRNLPLSIENIENNIFDIAGIRVICAFPEDIYMIAMALLRQDD